MSCFVRLIYHIERIMEEKEKKTIIFTSTKRTADDITRFLRQDGFPALAIHGDKQQNERDWVLNQFRTGAHPIMVATDVASRGIGKWYITTWPSVQKLCCSPTAYCHACSAEAGLARKIDIFLLHC